MRSQFIGTRIISFGHMTILSRNIDTTCVMWGNDTFRYPAKGPPDMMSTSEGGQGKADVVMEVA